MPWTPNDATRHTHLANTPKLRELWSRIANERLNATGDEALAIREANSVIHTHHHAEKKRTTP